MLMMKLKTDRHGDDSRSGCCWGRKRGIVYQLPLWISKCLIQRRFWVSWGLQVRVLMQVQSTI